MVGPAGRALKLMKGVGHGGRVLTASKLACNSHQPKGDNLTRKYGSIEQKNHVCIDSLPILIQYAYSFFSRCLQRILLLYSTNIPSYSRPVFCYFFFSLLPLTTSSIFNSFFFLSSVGSFTENTKFFFELNVEFDPLNNPGWPTCL